MVMAMAVMVVVVAAERYTTTMLLKRDGCETIYHFAHRRTSWDELLERAGSIITDLSLDRHTLSRCSTTAEELAAMDVRPETWVELKVLEVVGERDHVPRFLNEALDFFRLVSDVAASHLKLLLENTFRTPWIAAKILSKDAELARTSARDLLHHVDTTVPANRTSFERHVLDSEELWTSLQSFAAEDPPVVVWRGRGKFEALFRFLGPRFLLAPDHVLDAERVHARWQWSCIIKRSVKFQALNASLRLTHYMEHYNLPDHNTLYPCLQAEIREHRIALQALADEDDVVLGYRSHQQQSSKLMRKKVNKSK